MERQINLALFLFENKQNSFVRSRKPAKNPKKFRGVKGNISLFFLISDLFGANPIPPILETQLRNTSAIIHAKYRGSSFKKMPDGTIAKQFSFNIINSVGIEKEKLTDKREVFLVTSRVENLARKD